MPKDDCDPFLSTGTMFAIFKSLGTTPDEKEALKTISKGLDTQAFSIFSISIGMLNGPTDFNIILTLQGSDENSLKIRKLGR